MNLFRLLLYAYLALSCDTPILEALWLAGDRITAELSCILPRLHYQLTRWRFTFDPFQLAWSYNTFEDPEKRACRVGADPVARLGRLSAWYNTTNKVFSFHLSYPANNYQIAEVGERFVTSYPSRSAWFNTLLFFLTPPVTPIPAIPFFEREQLALTNPEVKIT
jgi:hypothetical protein